MYFNSEPGTWYIYYWNGTDTYPDVVARDIPTEAEAKVRVAEFLATREMRPFEGYRERQEQTFEESNKSELSDEVEHYVARHFDEVWDILTASVDPAIQSLVGAIQEQSEKPLQQHEKDFNKALLRYREGKINDVVLD